MHKNIKIIISCIATFCLTIGLLGKLTNLMERKSSDQKYMDFFEQDEDFEVLFMGASNVLNAIYPMELWDDYGIISYNLGGHSNLLPTTYWVMRNALDYTNPKVVVIDCLSYTSNWKCSDKFSFVHQSMDAFPMSKTKIKAIWDLLDDKYLDEAIVNGQTRESAEDRTRMGLLWNYSVYHSRWNELEKNDFLVNKNLEKGAESRIGITRGQLVRIDDSQKIQEEFLGEQYLRRMIEECHERGIKVLLTYLPFPADEWKQKEANSVLDIAKEYNVGYINFLDLNIINYQTDCYDDTFHLNPSGARKITSYIGEYLVDNYGVNNQKNNPEYVDWHEDYEEYNELKNKNLRSLNSILGYLMLLSNDDLDIVIDFRNKDIFKNAWIMDLFENLGINVKELNEDTDFVIIKNSEKEIEILYDFRENGANKNSKLGKIEMIHDVSEKENIYNWGLYVNGEEYCAGNSIEDTSLQIVVKREDKIVDNIKYTFSVDSESTVVNLIDVNR